MFFQPSQLNCAQISQHSKPADDGLTMFIKSPIHEIDQKITQQFCKDKKN